MCMSDILIENILINIFSLLQIFTHVLQQYIKYLIWTWKINTTHVKHGDIQKKESKK